MRHKFSAKQGPFLQRFQEERPIERYIEQFVEEVIPSFEDRATDIGLPTIFQLNDGRSRLDERKGISRTPDVVGKEITREDFERRGITRYLQIDARTPDLFAIRG